MTVYVIKPYPVYEAQCCGSLLQSKFSGHFCMCSCQKAFVDQTDYYIRHSGNIYLLDVVILGQLNELAGIKVKGIKGNKK